MQKYIKKNLVILGAYGQENIGDEAMLKVLLSRFTDLPVNIYCNSLTPEKTKEEYGIETFFTGLRKDFWKKIGVFYNANFIVYGGGALIVELRMGGLSKRLPLYRALVINLFAKIFRKKVIYIGVSVENLESRFSRLLAYWIAALSDLFIVRDLESLHLLRGIGFLGAELGADLVMCTDSLKNHAVNSPRRVCILPVHRIPNFDKHYNNYIKSLAKVADKLSESGYRVEFYPMRTEGGDNWNDVRVLETIRSHTQDKRVVFRDKDYLLYTDKFAEYISGFDAVLSSRFHGLVYSLTQKVSCVISLSPFRKCVSIMNRFGMGEFSLESKDVTPEVLLKKITLGLASSPGGREMILNEEKALALASVNDVYELIKKYV